MSHTISGRDMFWFAVFHLGALVAVALLSGCAAGPLNGPSLFNKKPTAESVLERKTRMQQQLGQARMHEQGDRYEKAGEIYQRLVLEFPDQAEPFYRLALVKDREKKHSEAQQLYLRAIEIDPRNAEAVNSLGYSYFLSGNLQAARDSLARAVAMEPNKSRFRNNLGMTLGQMQLYQEALDQFMIAGGEDDAYYNLAFIYSTQSRFAEAKECFRRALQTNPRHEGSRVALESFERYERNPALRDQELLATGNSSGYWQEYKEDGSTGGDVQQVSHSESAASDAGEGVANSGSPRQQQLQARASSLLQRKMAGMRPNSADRHALSADENY